MSTLLPAMSGRALDQRTSFLENKQGESIGSSHLTLKERPFLPEGLGSTKYDADGVAARERTMVDAGVLHNYYIDPYYGKKLGMPPTSGSVSNLVLDAGSHDLNSLFQCVQNGIFITHFLGGNSNSTTGDFSFGFSGFRIRDGIKSIPVHEMNISGNAASFWNRLQMIGNDPYPYSAYRIPSLVFDGVQVSGSLSGSEDRT